jgi:CRP-like cAMP-binding protein
MQWQEFPMERARRAGQDVENPNLRDGRENTHHRLLWEKTKHYGPGMQVGSAVKCGPDRHQVIVSGWACDLRILCDGRRQIFAFLIPGDVITATPSHILTPYVVIALTQLLLVSRAQDFPADDDAQEAMSRADAILAAQRQEQLYDQLVRIGRLTARERTIHLLLELHHRLERVGLVKDDTFKVPVNQEVLADALGMSVVHINRTLRELRDEDLLRIKAGAVTLKNLPKLIAISGYAAPD